MLTRLIDRECVVLRPGEVQDKHDGIEFLLSTALCADRVMLIFELHNV